jgi:hypothetical protein
LIVDVDENRSDRHTYEAFSAVQAGAQPVSQPPVPDFAATDDEAFCALLERIANHLIFDEASVPPAAA